MRPEPIFDLEQLELDFDNPLYDLDEIRKVNPQRHEMEQLSGVLLVDEETRGIIGFKDITEHEFWVRGHMPDFPLMPGVVMCEAAAQLGGFYARKFKLIKGDFLGFGGMNDIRFRMPVQPGARLVLMARVLNVRAAKRCEFEFQGYVEGRLAFSGTTIGVSVTRPE
jgi:3-hydroxyacyl-[acyl-carrier-protein] dehydratase